MLSLYLSRAPPASLGEKLGLSMRVGVFMVFKKYDKR